MVFRVALLWLFLISLLSQQVFSAPAAPFPIELKQPDGTKFTAYLKGDEWNSWHEDDKGFFIVKDKKTGYWYYAESVGGTLVKTPHIVGKVDPVRAGIQKGSPPVGNVPFNSLAYGTVPYPIGFPSVPHTQNLLVIFTTFNDQPNTYLANDWSSRIFGPADSLRTYYQGVTWDPSSSDGLLKIVPAVEDDSSIGGTANDGIVGPILPSYNSGNHPQCQDLSNTTNADCHRELAASAIQGADTYVDFSQFDANNDGTITPDELSIIVIVAGYESSAGPCQGYSAKRVWGHRWVFSSPLNLDGVSIRDYAMFGEQHCWGGNPPTVFDQASVGIIAHEFGHLAVGWPDLYDTDGTSSGIAQFGLMGGGSWGYDSSVTGALPGDHPVMPTAWSLWKAELIKSNQIIDILYDGTYSIGMWGDLGNRSFVRILLPGTSEYFLVEYRYPTGLDAGFKGLTTVTNGGFAIYHYDDSMWPTCSSSNNCNADETNYMLDVEEASGTQDLEAASQVNIDDNDFWTQSGTSTFSPASTPNTNDKAGNPTGITLTANSNPAATSTTMDLNVSGLGTPPPPSVSADPASWDYGCVKPTNQLAKDFRISNVGGQDLTIRAISLQSGTAGFAIDQTTAPSPACALANDTILPGQHCFVRVVFQPSSVGNFSDALSIIDTNDPNNTSVNVPLTGQGANPQVSVSPTSHDFGTIDVTQTVSQTFTISAGCVDLTLQNISISQSGTIFSISQDNCKGSGSYPVTLPANQSCAVTVEARSSTAASNYTGTLQIQSDDPSSPTNVNLQVSFVQNPIIDVNPSSYDFGDVNVGSSASKEFILTNSGSADLNVTNVSIQQTTSSLSLRAKAGDFSVNTNGGSNPCGSVPFNLTPSSSCTIVVSVTPSSAGKISANLSIESNDPNSPFTVNLSANGVSAGSGGGGGTGGGGGAGGGSGGGGGGGICSVTTGPTSPLQAIFTWIVPLVLLLRRLIVKRG